MLCSKFIGPRKVLGKDPNLDYDVFSDEEWEEEPDGEDIDGNDHDEEEGAMEEEDEEDGSFMVAGAAPAKMHIGSNIRKIYPGTALLAPVNAVCRRLHAFQGDRTSCVPGDCTTGPVATLHVRLL
jgi:hypothetical protein